MDEPVTPLIAEFPDAVLEVRDAALREIDMRLLPWDTAIDTMQGREQFSRGAFADVRADNVLLMGLEHEAHLGLGQDGRPTMTRRPVGRGTSITDEADGPHLTARVARTQSGDELLALAGDRIIRGVSVEFVPLPGGTSIETRSGRRVSVHNRVDLRGVSLTYRPAYGELAAVLAVRSEDEGEAPMTEAAEAVQETPTPQEPAVDITPLTRAVESMSTGFAGFAARLEAVEEQTRSQIIIPGVAEEPGIDRGHWMSTVLRSLAGERVADAEMRVMADLVTGDNLGVVPEAFSAELIGVIDANRPFLQSVRRVPVPTSGMTLNMPVLTTRPTAGVQAAEKDDITSTTTSITNRAFDAVTIAGGGDLSLQLLRRSSPSYLDLYLALLAEALSENAEAQAIAALFAAGTTPGTANIDFEALLIGEAFANAAAVKQRADTIWLSTDAMVAAIDAKVDGTNAPLYSTLAANITVGGAAGGTISALRPVWVPALDGTTVDVIVGPSRGYAWAEDGTYTLQVDVPSKAGRDVALVVMDFYAPLYPTAFTTYDLGS